MRTSLNEIEQIENVLLNRGDSQDRLISEARILINPDLMSKARWQSETYSLIHHYGREKLLKEIKAMEQELFQASKYRSFQDRIRSIFNK